MSLMKITDITNQFGITSRTLRYYEQVGLLQSNRLLHEKYRYYDEENISRLQQIIVLRKMQIPIKDIITIYESRDMTVLVQSFITRINAIDDEIETLSELKALVNDFLEAMLDHGISHISALPLIYEKIESQPIADDSKKPLTMERLSQVSDKLAKPLDISIVELPSMRVLSSRLQGTGHSYPDKFWDFMARRQLPFGAPGSRSLFEYQDEEMSTVFIQKVDTTYENDSDFLDYELEGGLFAICSAYADEDIGELHQRMMASFDDNPSFEVDFRHDGRLRHDSLAEAVICPDISREKINLYLPVKKRQLDAKNYENIEQINHISFAEIEKENPVLSEYPVDFHKITTIYDPHYKVLDNGEAEFICWISARMLSTNVAVKIPFRVDIEFLIDSESERYGYGTDEGSLWFSHNNNTYSINAENSADSRLSKHAIAFNQPIIGNRFVFPKIGDIKYNEYNRLTWVIGEKHFAVIINGEVRYCGVNFPYMSMDMHLKMPENILIGSNGQGKKRFRSIKISQLKSTPKINIKKGDLTIAVKQSNNRLPNFHQMVTLHYGENYWFNGCAKFVMECLGEEDYDYSLFAGLTGDNFAQVYSHNHFRGDGVTDYRLSEKGNHSFIEDIFAQCGYTSSFIPLKQLLNNREMYVQTLISYIDKGVPVIFNFHNWAVFVGYEDYGKTLLYMGGDATEPSKISLEDLLRDLNETDDDHCKGWVFIGEKKTEIPLADIYRNRILTLPALLTFENENYCFGAQAFRAWADAIQNGKLVEDMMPEQFESWSMYTIYVCNLATNSGGCRSFLEKAMELNPDFGFLQEVIEAYRQSGYYWNDQNGEDLEALGGGFNVTLSALQDNEKREKIAAKIREFAVLMDKVVAVISDGLNK